MENIVFVIMVFLSVVCLLNSLLTICLPFLTPLFLQRLAKFGKLSNTGNSFQLPRSWCSHYYLFANICMALVLFAVIRVYVLGDGVPSVVQALLDNLIGRNRKVSVKATTVTLAVILMQIQVMRRYYECTMVSIYSASVKQDLHVYIMGFFYYLFACLSLLAEAEGFSQINNGQDGINNYSGTMLSELSTWNHVIGTVLFFYFSWVQFKSQIILAGLRKNQKGKVITNKHSIPRGFWFDYVSCPHYFAEIMIYLSLSLIMLGLNLTWWSITLLVVSNLTMNAIFTHSWYLEKFADYPKDRKAIIPFIL